MTVSMQRLADMAHYMTDAEMYEIEGLEPEEAMEALGKEFGSERVEQLLAMTMETENDTH